MGIIMSEKTFKCDNCTDLINSDDDVFYGSESSGKTFCEGCYIDDRNSASTVYLVGPSFEFDYDEKPVTVYVSENFVENRYGESFDDLKMSRVYKNTSAWRGYNETSIKGWVEVFDGWTTGGWGDPTADRKQVFNEWAESLLTAKSKSPVDVAIIMDSTSNVFSMGVGVHVPKESLGNFTEWLDGELENLRYALS